jgi:pimeloyl-ACP methyl ester carboxylesterase
MKLEVITHEPVGSSKTVPLLFVHGAWHGAWCWNEHFLPYFAEHGYASHALSLRGHGESDIDKSLRLARIKDYVADVAAVAADLDVPPVIIGHSMGGLVTQVYLEDHPATAGVLLASDPVKGVLRTTLSVARRHPVAFLKANLTWDLYPIVSTPSLAKEAFFSEDLSDEVVAGYFERLQSESYLAYLDMMFRLPKPDKVAVPMLVMGGEKDTIFTPHEVGATAAAYGTEAVIVPGVAHDMMLDTRWESVADRMLIWLEGLSEI